jgi:hypothetical protein
MAIGNTAAVADLMCTNLMLSGTSVTCVQASDLLLRADAGALKDGNIRLSIDRSAGVTTCTVGPTPPRASTKA